MSEEKNHWRVEVHINGEEVLGIESNSLGGIENISDYADEVRECAYNLLSFIGESPEHSLGGMR